MSDLQNVAMLGQFTSKFVTDVPAAPTLVYTGILNAMYQWQFGHFIAPYNDEYKVTGHLFARNPLAHEQYIDYEPPLAVKCFAILRDFFASLNWRAH